MHDYSINSGERKQIPFYIAAVSILLIFLLRKLVTLPEWVPVPSAFALYIALYNLFDKFLWKWTFLHQIGLIHTPNLSGQWTMETASTLTEYKITYQGRLQIEQTWTCISLFFEGSNAFSTSLMAAISVQNHSFFALEWEYLSKKKPEFSDEDYMHYGITRVQWTGLNPKEFLEGDYYTDRSRHQYGQVAIKKA